MGPVALTSRTTGAASEAVLVRREARGRWLRTLPAAPSAEVTVSLTDAAAAIRHAAELAQLGYTPVGAAGCVTGEPGQADFLVTRELAAAEEGWLRALLGPQGRLYQLSHGPVQALLAPVLEAHGYPTPTEPSGHPR